MRAPRQSMSSDPSLFGIGEFSQISGLSVKTLRFYDENLPSREVYLKGPA